MDFMHITATHFVGWSSLVLGYGHLSRSRGHGWPDSELRPDSRFGLNSVEWLLVLALQPRGSVVVDQNPADTWHICA